jgi:putative toxin-antitoxin system antitoxin component (TIGR02293 family)
MAYTDPSEVLAMTTAMVAEILGGKKVLGRAVTRSSDLSALVREGIPAQALMVLAERTGLRQADVSARFGIPQRTLTRRLAQHSRLTAAESDRTVRLAQVYATAIETLGDEEKAAAWLKTPNRALRGERPLDQLDTDPGVREVENILGRIAYGVYS